MSLKKLVKLLIKNNLTISTCESFTGGLFSNLITNITNSSKVFFGSFVCYQTKFKENILNIDKQVIKKDGVISFNCAKEMVLKTYELTKTNIVVSFTGNAGPNSMENKPKGLAYIGIKFNDQIKIYEFKPRFVISRKHFKNKTIKFVVKILKKMVLF
ncbi:CinA family protein [Mycoplasma feriruminatoris]|uniref:CinA family protein n=1 Tax=Mycoplasma feriruminatoris TaxID=1179777 RepID=UPI00241FFE6E|nr:nicotinamide-nucleotide amidohydrolase family protein [Mycoplasma feriruminatoris]WFQ90254.1 Protein MG115 [Mycoplasma feriruminatoris]